MASQGNAGCDLPEERYLDLLARRACAGPWIGLLDDRAGPPRAAAHSPVLLQDRQVVADRGYGQSGFSGDLPQAGRVTFAAPELPDDPHDHAPA
jgi:hypothetical protein